MKEESEGGRERVREEERRYKRVMRKKKHLIFWLISPRLEMLGCNKKKSLVVI